MKVAALLSLTATLAIPAWAQLNGAPYSATQVSQRVQTLADGTHITQPEQKTLLYRDSAGRTRHEFTPALPPNAPANIAVPAMIDIMDPVAGFHYALDARTKTARRSVVNIGRPQEGGGFITPGQTAGVVFAPGVQAPVSLPSAQQPANRMLSKNEDLGTQMIEGLLCAGRRITITTPAGVAGNDRDLVAVTEIWTSQDLKMTLLTKRMDPRSGESVTKLTDVNRAEPDPALFMVPPDYTIQDQPQPNSQLGAK